MGKKARRGIEPEKIQEVIQNASSEQKSEIIDELIKKEDMKLLIDEDAVNKANISKAEDIIYKKYKDAGQDDKTAEDYAKVQALMLAGIAEAEEREIEEVTADYAPSMENIKDMPIQTAKAEVLCPKILKKD